jgi:hypothetical protein
MIDVSSWIGNGSPEVVTVLLAMLPVGELRLALPTALVVYKLPVLLAVLYSIIGNMLPVYFLLVFFERASTWLSERSELARRGFEWLFTSGKIRLLGSGSLRSYSVAGDGSLDGHVGVICLWVAEKEIIFGYLNWSVYLGDDCYCADAGYFSCSKRYTKLRWCSSQW